MLKLGENKNVPLLFSHNNLISSKLSSQPVVPQTTGISFIKHFLIFSTADEGVEKMIATSVSLKSSLLFSISIT